MDEKLKTVLREYRKGLEAIYGDRLKRLILYGSQARGDATPESDIDVLVVLEGPVDAWREIQRTSRLTNEVCLRHDAFIQRSFATPEQVRQRGPAFLETAAQEGVEV